MKDDRGSCGQSYEWLGDEAHRMTVEQLAAISVRPNSNIYMITTADLNGCDCE